MLYQHTGCTQLLPRASVTALGFSQTPGAHGEGGFGQSGSTQLLARQAACWPAGDSTSGRAVAWKHPRAWTAVPRNMLILLRAHRGTALIATWIIHLKLASDTKTRTSSKYTL